MTDLMFFHDLPAEEQRAMLEDEAIRVGPILFHAVEEKESVRVPTNDERRAMWASKYYNQGEHRDDHAIEYDCPCVGLDGEHTTCLLHPVSDEIRALYERH